MRSAIDSKSENDMSVPCVFTNRTACSPSPQPSPSGRASRAHRLSTNQALRYAAQAADDSPSPWGEGSGEGKGVTGSGLRREAQTSVAAFVRRASLAAFVVVLAACAVHAQAAEADADRIALAVEALTRLESVDLNANAAMKVRVLK